jgi:hypothetical protein
MNRTAPTNHRTPCEWNDNNRCLVINGFEIQAFLGNVIVWKDGANIAEFGDMMDAISFAANR